MAKINITQRKRMEQLLRTIHSEKERQCNAERYSEDIVREAASRMDLDYLIETIDDCIRDLKNYGFAVSFKVSVGGHAGEANRKVGEIYGEIDDKMERLGDLYKDCVAEIWTCETDEEAKAVIKKMRGFDLE